MMIRKYLQISKSNSAGDKSLFEELEKALKHSGFTVYNDALVLTFFKEIKPELIEIPIDNINATERVEDDSIVKFQILRELYKADAKNEFTAISYATESENQKVLDELVSGGFIQFTNDNKIFLTTIGIYEYKLSEEDGVNG